MSVYDEQVHIGFNTLHTVPNKRVRKFNYTQSIEHSDNL